MLVPSASAFNQVFIFYSLKNCFCFLKTAAYHCFYKKDDSMTDIHSNHFQVAGNGKVACLNIKKAWNFPGFFPFKISLFTRQ